MKFIDPEEVKKNTEEESKPAEVYSEIAEPEMPEIDDAQIRALALAYARYLKDHNLAPGDATNVEPEEIGVSVDGLDVELDIEVSEDEEAPEQEDELFENVEISVDEPDEEAAEEELFEETPAEEPVEEEIPEADETIEEPEEIFEEITEEESVEEEELPEAEKESDEPEEAPAEESVEETIEESVEEQAEEITEDLEEKVPTEEPAEETSAEEEIPETVEKAEDQEEIFEEVTEEESAEEEYPAEESIEETPAEDEPVEEEALEETPVESIEETTEEESDESEETPTEESVEETTEESAEKQNDETADAPAKKKSKEDPKKKAIRKARERAAKKKLRKRLEAKEKNKEKFLKGGNVPLAGITNLHDKIQDGIDGAFVTVGKQAVSGAHKISSTYTQTRKGIAIAVLITGLLAAGLLVVFDIFTVYEYAYNGKVLGYVKNQEEVTDVLDVAGRQLTYNSSTEADVKFVANQNVTFNPVDGRGKSTDDSDTVVNKLIYMTDIETEAYAVYDGDKAVAIVKDQNDADNLLLMTKADLSVPDKGMELIFFRIPQ